MTAEDDSRALWHTAAHLFFYHHGTLAIRVCTQEPQAAADEDVQRFGRLALAVHSVARLGPDPVEAQGDEATDDGAQGPPRQQQQVYKDVHGVLLQCAWHC